MGLNLEIHFVQLFHYVMALEVHKRYSFNAIVNVVDIKIDVCCKISRITMS